MEHLILRDCVFTFDPDAEALVPAMALQVEPCRRRGVIAGYLQKLTLEMDADALESIIHDPLPELDGRSFTQALRESLEKRFFF